MVGYIEKLFPFLENSDLIKTEDMVMTIEDIYCPLYFNKDAEEDMSLSQAPHKKAVFQAVRVQPCNVLMLNEPESVIKKAVMGDYGNALKLNVMEYDYTGIASRVECADNEAFMQIGTGYLKQEIASKDLITSAANGFEADKEVLKNIVIEASETAVSFRDWLSGYSLDAIEESTDMFDGLLSDIEDGKGAYTSTDENTDNIYKWLDAYFSLPEGVSAKQGGREVVPLLIGPTGVFKSATVKELCKKYDYRLLDFRVAFTSRLDYSGLFQMGVVDDKRFSYSCAMEELVTCSDGFREYCKRAYDKVSQILQDGYMETSSASDGEVTESSKEPISEEQRKELEKVLSRYKEYMRPVVIFFDEITRCKDLGVEGLLTEMLNQKRFNNMQMQGCKFVAATNLNLVSKTNARHNNHMQELDDMYDVNTDIDVAYANRFLPLRVQPEDVQDRWFSWAKNTKVMSDGSTRFNIHPVIFDFLNSPQGKGLVYNDTPVLEAIEKDLTLNEQKSQVYPNYRTWEMVSNYLYTIDKEYDLDTSEDKKKMYKVSVLNSIISSWGAEKIIPVLESNGYVDYSSVKGEVDDEFTDFLETSLEANVPALLVGPSSIGKTSRVKAYIRKQKEKTGLEPVLINVDLSSKDAVDLMGIPSKVSIIDYVAGDLSKVPSIGKELSKIVEDVTKDDRYGLTDILTVRAPDKTTKEKLLKAKREGREVIFMFDEMNRVKNTSVLSAVFEASSDSRFGGIDFSDMKDRVKIIAACNMAHSEMEDTDAYSSAGDLDPALAARFAVFWKKKYDEKDVKSWINFMEMEKAEGKIDGTIINYFKSLDPEKAVEIISSVEKRQLAYALPSTRNLHQLSMDIKSMRGTSELDKSKLFYGKLLFDDTTRNELGELNDMVSSSTHTDLDISNKALSLIDEIIENEDVWDSKIVNRKVTMNGKELTATDLVDNLKKCKEEILNIIQSPTVNLDPKKQKALNNLAIALLRACNDLDDITHQTREAIFETYVGEEFARDFTPYFNENFGSESDEEITIEMLSDKKLIKPFFRKYRSLRTGMVEEKYEDSILDLMREYIKVHGTSLTPDKYAAFIDGAKASLASQDGMERILKNTTQDIDELFVQAEKIGDSWILKTLSGTRVTQEDIDSMRSKMSHSSKTSSKKSVVL